MLSHGARGGSKTSRHVVIWRQKETAGESTGFVVSSFFFVFSMHIIMFPEDSEHRKQKGKLLTLCEGNIQSEMSGRVW